jgi:regulatory protein
VQRKNKSRVNLSLRQRALAALARREYSRIELARKIAPHAESIEQIDHLLDALESEGVLSDQRFAESLVHRRAPRYGRLYIERELGEHGLEHEIIEAQLSTLMATELERCQAIWQKKFGSEPPIDIKERARQIRFLTAHGFDATIIRQVVPSY